MTGTDFIIVAFCMLTAPILCLSCIMYASSLNTDIAYINISGPDLISIMI